MKLKVIIFLFAGLVIATAATAGRKEKLSVYIDDTYNRAEGYIGSVRNSSNDVEFIECKLEVMDTGKTATCKAKDSAGTSRSCVTSNADLIGVLKMLTDSSYLLFGWNAKGICYTITVGASSKYERPKN